MKFYPAPVNENLDLLRFVSEGGKWELGWLKMLFGVRVRLGRVGAFTVDADLCCGAGEFLRWYVIGYVLGKLDEIKEEELTGEMVRKLFPHPEVKPLDRDPVWQELFGLKPSE